MEKHYELTNLETGHTDQGTLQHFINLWGEESVNGFLADKFSQFMFKEVK